MLVPTLDIENMKSRSRLSKDTVEYGITREGEEGGRRRGRSENGEVEEPILGGASGSRQERSKAEEKATVPISCNRLSSARYHKTTNSWGERIRRSYATNEEKYEKRSEETPCEKVGKWLIQETKKEKEEEKELEGGERERRR